VPLWKLRLGLIDGPLDQLAADAVLALVDGGTCVLDLPTREALLGGHPSTERDDDLMRLAQRTQALAPIDSGRTGVVHGLAPWPYVVVAAMQSADGPGRSPSENARNLLGAVTAAVQAAHARALKSIAVSLAGVELGMPLEMATYTFVAALRTVGRTAVIVRLSVPTATHRKLAESACRRFGVPF
jgi:hypothetical protein